MADLEPTPLSRTRLFEALCAVVRRAERTATPCALFLVSVNTLGAINAYLGNEIGDELIAEAGRLLASTLGPNDMIGRYSSNMYAIVVDPCADGALRGVGEGLMQVVRNSAIPTSAGPLAASVSIGAVEVPRHARTGTEALQNALLALELAKQRPAGAFIVYESAMRDDLALNRGQLAATSVIGALEDKRIVLVLQPIVSAATRKVALFEGLVRLVRPDGAMVTAAEFIEDAEKLGLAPLIDRRALELGLGLLDRHPGLRLAINISSLTAGDATWTATLRKATDSRRDIAERLTVEMTETAMIHDFDAAKAFFDLLRGIGCRIAIDDFGAGYSSFRHLKSLNVDMLKIDGALVENLKDDSRGRALVKSMIEMGDALGLETVAEWVGDEEAAAFLKAAGVTYLQGYLFGEPAAADELTRAGVL